MKVSTAQETKDFFLLFSGPSYKPKLFEGSKFYDEIIELERDRQRMNEFFLQFVDLGEMEWHKDLGLFEDLGLKIINSIRLSDGTEIHAIGKSGEITGYLTPFVIAIKIGEK